MAFFAEIRIGIAHIFTTRRLRRSRAEYWHGRAQAIRASDPDYQTNPLHRKYENLSKIWGRYRRINGRNASPEWN